MEGVSRAPTPISRKLFDLPDAMAALPVDERGYPVPKFVEWVNGKPDFRVMSAKHWVACVKQNLCWLCGGKLGKRKWFVIGPMCCVNRVSAEPPSHRLCAEFAVKNCPFLTKPLARRNDRGLPDGKHVGGIMIERNPGVSAIWETENFKITSDGQGGYVLIVGDPRNVTFWSKGELATRADIMESVVSGVPFLWNMAEKEGEDAKHALIKCCEKFRIEVLERFTSAPPRVLVEDILRECYQ